jgi:hypothetical protein
VILFCGDFPRFVDGVTRKVSQFKESGYREDWLCKLAMDNGK